MKLNSIFFISLMFLFLNTACAQEQSTTTDAGDIEVLNITDGLNHPWGMDILPDGRILVSERSGNLRILDNKELSEPVPGVPQVFAVGQGGLLDVQLDPEFDQNQYVYLSFAEPGDNNTASTALGRGKFINDQIQNFEVIFSQEPKESGPNHFGGRIEFIDDNTLYFTLGERFKFDPAQNLENHLGTIVRINKDGTIPNDNPFVNEAEAKDEIFSYGHRNIEAAAIDPATGKLWIAEMGPLGGDELNQPEAGKNYGWPVVSWGKNYDGSEIPDPTTQPKFADAKIHWTPVISPSGMIFYTGDMFPRWKGSALIGGLTATGLVRVTVNGESAEEVERIPLEARIRDVVQAPDGSIYVLTDKRDGNVWQLKPMK